VLSLDDPFRLHPLLADGRRGTQSVQEDHACAAVHLRYLWAVCTGVRDGSEVDSWEDIPKWTVLISLREVKNRGYSREAPR